MTVLDISSLDLSENDLDENFDLEIVPQQDNSEEIKIDPETGWPLDSDSARPATEKEAASFLLRFFDGEKWHIGGKIPDRIITQTRHIELVRRLDLPKCIPFFYQALEQYGYGLTQEEHDFINRIKSMKSGHVAIDSETNNTYREVIRRRDRTHAELFFELQKKMRTLQIPKHHSGGLLLVYVILVFGWDI